MEISVQDVIKDWVQYLKNNRIISMTSSPKTGRLRYNRKPTTNDVRSFLNLKTDFDESDIETAIRAVLSGRPPEEKKPRHTEKYPVSTIEPGTRDLSTWHYNEITPAERPIEPEDDFPVSTKRYRPSDTDDVEDADYNIIDPADQIEYDDLLKLTHKPMPRKPRFKYRYKTNEDIHDKPNLELSEKEIRSIFRILVFKSRYNAAQEMGHKAEPVKGPSQEELQLKREEDVRKIKRLIRDVMTEQQRNALWRMLND